MKDKDLVRSEILKYFNNKIDSNYLNWLVSKVASAKNGDIIDNIIYYDEAYNGECCEKVCFG